MKLRTAQRTEVAHEQAEPDRSPANAQDQLQAALCDQNPSRGQGGAACQLYPPVRLGPLLPADRSEAFQRSQTAGSAVRKRWSTWTRASHGPACAASGAVGND
jgi:hypothetical protein